MQSLMLPPPAQQALAKAALTYRFGEEHQPVTESQLLAPRRWQDESGDLWTTYQRIQENLIKGGLNGRTAKVVARTPAPFKASTAISNSTAPCG